MVIDLLNPRKPKKIKTRNVLFYEKKKIWKWRKIIPLYSHTHRFFCSSRSLYLIIQFNIKSQQWRKFTDEDLLSIVFFSFRAINSLVFSFWCTCISLKLERINALRFILIQMIYLLFLYLSSSLSLSNRLFFVYLHLFVLLAKKKENK